MEEIKVELRQDNIAVKANAVAKLTYVSTQLNLHVVCILIYLTTMCRYVQLDKLCKQKMVS